VSPPLILQLIKVLSSKCVI